VRDNVRLFSQQARCSENCDSRNSTGHAGHYKPVGIVDVTGP